MKFQTLAALALIAVINLTIVNTFGQTTAPVISYTAPAAFSVNAAITPLTPTLSGGASVNGGFGVPVTVAGGGSPGGVASGAADGTGSAATFNSPYGLAPDGRGNLFVADRLNHTIRKIVLSTGVVSTFAGTGASGYANGTGTAAAFTYPTGVAVDTTGNIYVADSRSNLIRKITPSGVVSRFAGGGNGLSSGFADGVDSVAIFNRPTSVAVDQSGNVYVADQGNNKIRQITPAGLVSSLAGDSGGNSAASVSAAKAEGTGSAVSFNNPSGIAFDGNGKLVVTNAGSASVPSFIRKITISSAYVSFLAGCGSVVKTYLDGTGGDASFLQPYGVATDLRGNSYVADLGNNLIRKITSAGVVTTIAGGLGTTIAGSFNAAGATGLFNAPAGVAADSTGNLYIADSGNNLIRKIPVAPYSISPPLPAGLSFNTTTAVISGTPTAESPLTTYTISAANSAGSASTTVDLTVNLSAPAISYSGPQNYPLNIPIPPLGPSNTGGTPSPDLVTTLAGGGSNGGTTAGSSNNTGTAATFSAPSASVTDASGTTYIADKTNNLIRKISPAGVVTTLAGSGSSGSADGTGAAATFNAPQGIAADGAGNLYIADTGSNKIRKIVISTGVVTTFAGTGASGYLNGTGSSATFSAPTGLAIYSGYIYVADAGNHKIRKILISSTVVTAVCGSSSNVSGNVNGSTTATRFNNPTGITFDAAGNLYVADQGNNLIRKFVASTSSTLAGGGIGTATNGTGTAATFNAPSGVAADPYGNLYVADKSNNLIRKIDTSWGTVTTFAGTIASGHADGRGTAATFSTPTGIAVDPFGNVLVADQGNNLIRKITTYTITPALPAGLTFETSTGTIFGTPTVASAATSYTINCRNSAGADSATVTIATLAIAPPAITYTTPNSYTVRNTLAPLTPVNTGGTPTSASLGGGSLTLAGGGSDSLSSGNANGTGRAATFSAPCGTAIDGSGNTYVADRSNNLIRKITPSGEVTTLAGSGSAGFANGIGTAASFNQPSGIATDGQGNLYVADAGNNMIRKIVLSTGSVSVFSGTGTSGSSNTINGYTFSGPSAVAIDSIGSIYVADQNNNLIRKITLSGLVSTLAGGGSGVATNGTGTAATFNAPSGVAADLYGNLYIADKANNLIRKIVTATGVVTTLAGTTTAGHADGTGVAATFNGPSGLALDGFGNLYVSDGGNNTIRKIVLSTAEVTTVAGSTTAGHAEGTGTAARFSAPAGLAFDGTGNLFIADQSNNLIRKIPSVPYSITPALPAGLTMSSTTGIISGTPTLRSPATTYTIGTGNSAGLTSTTLSLTVFNLPKVNRYGKITTDNDYVDQYGRIGGASGVDSNGKVTP